MSNVRVTVTDEDTPNRLARTTWAFWLYEARLVLESYVEESRPSRRHSYKTDRAYFRLTSDSSLLSSQRIAEKDVPLDANIKRRAVEEFVRQLRVIRWSER
jgi:hypothetical protein